MNVIFVWKHLLLVQCLKCKYTVCSKCKYKMKLKCPICDR